MEQDKEISLITCEIFLDELQEVLSRNGYSVDVHWIRAALHTDLKQLELKIEQALSLASQDNKRPAVLYGSGCLPDIDNIFRHHGAKGCLVCNCLEAFLGREKKQKYEADGCFILTPGWVRAWPSITTALGWDSVDIKTNLGRYKKIVVFDAGVNPLTDEEVIDFFDLTGLLVEIIALDLKHFESLVAGLLQGEATN